MAKHTNKILALALVGAGTYAAVQLGQALLGSDAQATEHAVNQLWIDHIPQDDRDMIFHMVLIDHRDGQFGAFGHSSQWRHRLDVFRWQLQGSTLGMYFPQDRVKGEVKVETWSCVGEAPAPFELCMRLTNKKGGSVVLYSREDWKIEPHDMHDSLADIAEEQPMLNGLLHGMDEDEAERIGAVELDDADVWPLRDPF